MITVIITSYNRFDLLCRTIESFNAVNTAPIEKFIIIDDSGNEFMHRKIRSAYPHYHLILNGHIGLVESIDRAYSEVTTPYIFHSEDDFNYHRGGFIEKSIQLMENDPTIFRVGIRGQTHNTSLDDEIHCTAGINYRMAKFHSLDIVEHRNQFWHGFGFQCGMIRKSAYDLVRPYTQYSAPNEFITIRECKIGTSYYNLGLRAVSLVDDYATHTGNKRSTYGLRMEG